MTLVFFGLICSASFWHPAKLSVIKIISQWVQIVNYEAIKAELPLEGIFFALNFLPWEFLLVKKLEIEKIKTTFMISVLKVVYLVVLVFSISNILLIKIPREENRVRKKNTF